MKSTKPKRYKLWLIVACVCLVLAVGSGIGVALAQQSGNLISSSNISTGLRNYSLLYNEQTGYTLVGSQQNILLAYDAEGNQGLVF